MQDLMDVKKSESRSFGAGTRTNYGKHKAYKTSLTAIDKICQALHGTENIRIVDMHKHN